MITTDPAENDPRPGPSAPRQHTVMELIRTADELRRYFTALYEPHGITPQQYNVLRILRGSRSGALPTMEIAERMVEKTPGITRLLDRLEEKGLVERERTSDDRRRVLISITAPGRTLLAELDEPVRKATAGVLEGFSTAEVARLDAALKRIQQDL